MVSRKKTAFAIAAHPDDIEFMMAGTLVLLKQAGYEIHCMNIANGDCGSATLPPEKIARMRAREARASAALMGAVFHPSFARDIQILYDVKSAARLCAVVREVNPEVLLVPSPQDYMEDHVNASRLAVTAAFCRSIGNFATIPRTKPVIGDVTVYHGLPYGLRDDLRGRIHAGCYVDIGPVLDLKREALARHKSQKEWLDYCQGLDAYLTTMVDMAAEVGRMSGKFKYAEGWRRHNHLGFCGPDSDPLRTALGKGVVVDAAYARALEGPPGPRRRGKK